MDSFFSGSERIETFGPLGRPMRHGRPMDLQVADYQRVREALKSRNAKSAKEYLGLLHEAHMEVVGIMLEWTLEWSQALSKHVTPQQAHQGTKAARDLWIQDVSSLKTDADRAQGVDMVLQLLSLEALLPGKSEEFRQARDAGKRTAATEITERLIKRQQQTLAVLDAGDFEQTERKFSEYWAFVNSFHDCLVQYAQSFPAAILKAFGQEMSERCISESFSDSSFYEAIWSFFSSLTPYQLAAFLAEHLRNHFSGQGREGTVEIVEESDRYRLVFDACGSGGAMRRRMAQTDQEVTLLPHATNGTWNLKNQVSPYCSHCAYNEMSSTARVGFPMFVTEFNTDHFKPCGWTVYKNPDLIPEKYFSRIGLKRDASKFKKNAE